MIECLIEQLLNPTIIEPTKNKQYEDDTASATNKEKGGKKETIFKLPIEYLENKVELEEHTINDLELGSTDKHESLYSYLFNPTTVFGKDLMEQWGKYYTPNTLFLKDSQKLLKCKLKGGNGNHNKKAEREQREERDEKEGTQASAVNADLQKEVIDIWNEIQNETGFNEKYNYIEWKQLDFLNNSSLFLQFLCIYNVASPLFSLMIPIIFLIVPLLIIKLRGLPITLGKYIELLKIVFQKHQLGKIFDVSSASFEKLVYVFATGIFYVIQVYQNISTCRRFICNMTKIHEQLIKIRYYLTETITNMDLLIKQCAGLKTYEEFVHTIQHHRSVCKHMKSEFDKVAPNKVSITKLRQIGFTMKCFYQLYNHRQFHETLIYTFGLNGYIDNMDGIIQNIREKNINSCKFKKSISKFDKAYFPSLVKENPVKNTYTLDKHLIITGPNAAGKTTLLKTTIFNIIISQQIGFGFYHKATINPYDMIHCYINIPDTSGRDSLFQAEAKRCKDILNHILNINDNDKNQLEDEKFSNTKTKEKEKDKNKRHFCVFDELYSGTNPYEAIGSAYAYLKFLNKFDNVNFVLTTHFLDLCRRLEKETKLYNFHMKIETINDDFKYTYKLEEGISTIKGGVKVLKDLNYPPEIIETTTATLNEMTI